MWDLLGLVLGSCGLNMGCSLGPKGSMWAVSRFSLGIPMPNMIPSLARAICSMLARFRLVSDYKFTSIGYRVYPIPAAALAYRSSVVGSAHET